MPRPVHVQVGELVEVFTKDEVVDIFIALGEQCDEDVNTSPVARLVALLRTGLE